MPAFLSLPLNLGYQLRVLGSIAASAVLAYCGSDLHIETQPVGRAIAKLLKRGGLASDPHDPGHSLLRVSGTSRDEVDHVRPPGLVVHSRGREVRDFDFLTLRLSRPMVLFV